MSTIFVAMEDAVLKVRPAGSGAWEAELSTPDASCRCLAADPGHPGRVYCGTADRGLLRSDDGGGSWRQAGSGISHPHVRAVAVSPAEDEGAGGPVLYAGTEPSAVFRSEDGGERWEELEGLTELPSAGTWSFPPRPDTHHVRWIGPDPREPGRVWVAIEAGALVRWEGADGTWHDRRPGGPRDTHTLVVHPEMPGRLHSAAGDGYFESHDGGESWQQPQAGLRHRYVWSCALAVDSGAVLVSAAGSARQAHRAASASSRIYRRVGEGPWEPVDSGLPGPDGTTVSALAADPTESGVVWAANNHGVHRSSDAGRSWERLDVEWPERFRQQRVADISVIPEDIGGEGC